MVKKDILLYSAQMIAIESNPELLKEYGRAFAYINATEFNLVHAIIYLGKMKQLDENLRKKILEGKTFGQKIELANVLLNPELIERLKILNKKRNALAHRMTGQKVTISVSGKMTLGEHTLGLGENSELLTVQSLQQTVRLAEKISSDLMALYEDDVGKLEIDIDVDDITS